MAVKFVEGKNYHCEETLVRVRVPAHLHHSGRATWEAKPIDTCIADIVRALTECGVYTDASCCGHGEGRGGNILLHDGRVLIVQFPDDWKAHR